MNLTVQKRLAFPYFTALLRRLGFPLPFGVVFVLCLGCNDLKTQQNRRITIKIDRYPLSVEIAATPDKRERGLMYRTHLKADEGMLFVFPYPRRAAFWMKNTLIPLDIGYFNSDGYLIEYMSMEPDDGAKSYPASGLTLYAVETNVGWFTKHHIRKHALLKLPHKINAW